MAERVELVQANALRLPFADERFDAIFISFVLELFDTPEIPLVLAECARMLRAGGRLAIVALALRGRPRLVARVYDWAHRAFPRVVACRAIPVQAFVGASGFHISQTRDLQVWGLPVDAVLASYHR